MENLKLLLKTDKSGLVNGYCNIPWREILIDYKGEIYNCGCEGKVTKSIGNLLDDVHNPVEFDQLFYDSDFKKSILDGSYRYCRAMVCPWLQQNILQGSSDNFDPNPDSLEIDKLIIYLPIDESCNLKCPTCRTETIIHKNNRRTETIKQILNKLESMILSQIKKTIIIRLVGSGELFASNTLLPWFLDFDFKKYPNVRFWIHTNGTLISRYENFLLQNYKKIFGFEVSIDAASEPVYLRTRLNGVWSDLLAGLETIKKIKDLVPDLRLAYSYTISDSNYTDINNFANFAFYHEANEVVFYKVQKWNHYTNENWAKANIFAAEHPLHQNLIEQINNFDFDRPNVSSNLLYLKK